MSKAHVHGGILRWSLVHGGIGMLREDSVASSPLDPEDFNVCFDLLMSLGES